jgi:hypothetical protein
MVQGNNGVIPEAERAVQKTRTATQAVPTSIRRAGRPYLWACACGVVDKAWISGVTETQNFAARDAGLGEAGRVVFYHDLLPAAWRKSALSA